MGAVWASALGFRFTSQRGIVNLHRETNSRLTLIILFENKMMIEKNVFPLPKIIKCVHPDNK